MPRLRHYNDPFSIRFITFSCYHHLPLLQTEFAKGRFLNNFEKNRIKYNYGVWAYAIMPDHVHLVIRTPETLDVGRAIGDLKAKTALEILADWKIKKYGILGTLRVLRNGHEQFAFWQKRSYDHNCRDRKSVIEKINYCHYNPVNKGLIISAEDYPWSSFGWYLGRNSGVVKLEGFSW